MCFYDMYMMLAYYAQIVATLLLLPRGLAKLNEIMFIADGRVYTPGYQNIDEKPISLRPTPQSNHGRLIYEKS